MARLQIGIADKVRLGSISIPVRVTPVDLPLTTATTGRARAWVRDLVGIIGALGYGVEVTDVDAVTEVRYRQLFIRVRA